MKQYWFGMRGESEWKPGSPWKLVSSTGEVWDAGAIIEADPPKRLVIRWAHTMKPELKAEGDTICTMDSSAAKAPASSRSRIRARRKTRR